jgi:MarR family 2-MHQ and catechol resistance regulon transcriptional repressor
MEKDGIITGRQKMILKTYVKMTRAVSTVSAKMHRHLLLLKLTVSQFGVLGALYNLGPLCQQEIGQKILKTSGNMTLVIDNLEKRGLVVRESDPDDRRYTRVRLTKEGEDLICRVFPRHAKIAEQVFSVLDADELEQLGFLMKKLGTHGNE